MRCQVGEAPGNPMWTHPDNSNFLHPKKLCQSSELEYAKGLLANNVCQPIAGTSEFLCMVVYYHGIHPVGWAS